MKFEFDTLRFEKRRREKKKMRKKMEDNVTFFVAAPED